jgi:ASC-1-like (ASCH) protein
LPSFLAKKEIFEWLKQGKKTIDVRKGNPQYGGNVLFVCGPYRLAMRIVDIQSGQLTDLIRQDNFRQVIPSAQSVDDALAYLRRIYDDCDGIFTAYNVTC